MTVIEVEGLVKEYRRFRGGSTIAVDGLDLSVPAGGVFGFLGPNGSGKTTTIRCLVGLIAPSAGSARLLGASGRTLQQVLPRVGSLVEAPAFFGNFSGRRNLRLLAAHYGIGGDRVDAVLERVGLADRADDTFKHYSLGMKQRLGIASTLLKDPEVLILDEPANGLDPAGIKEVRELLRALGDEGRTVFLSSHLLAEVQQVCDRVAILNRGKLIASGPVDEVLASGRTEEMLVRAADNDAAEAALRAAKYETRRLGDGSVAVAVPHADGEKVTRALVRKRIYPMELRRMTVDLETVFLQLTGEEEP